MLLNGTYGNSTGTGYPLINCSTTAHNGTSGAHITVQAASERQAWIRGTGAEEEFELVGCSYWDIIGLHVSGADNNVGNTFTGDVIAVFNSDHITLRRNIADHNNRYGNVHIILLDATTNSLVEENELYYFHRWGIMIYLGSTGNEIRRNYANNRGYDGIAGGYDNRGTIFSIGPYNANGNIFENNIEERTTAGSNQVVGLNIEDAASNNTILGNIAGTGLTFGTRVGPHVGRPQATGNTFINSVSILPALFGFWGRSSKSTYDHDSVFGNSGAAAGFQSDIDSAEIYPSYGFVVNNSTAQSFSAGTGYNVANTTGNAFSFDHNNNFGNAATYNPNLRVTNANSANPAFGACYLWVPDGSPLKGAGTSGSDIGATILYQYSGGILTGTPLWTGTGAPAFAGATVSGLNDVAGNSLFDIADRLNINKNGCVFPAAFHAGLKLASDPAAPTGLTATVQ